MIKKFIKGYAVYFNETNELLSDSDPDRFLIFRTLKSARENIKEKGSKNETIIRVNIILCQ